MDAHWRSDRGALIRIFPHRTVEKGEDKSKDLPPQRIKTSKQALLSQIYPRQPGEIYGIFERVIHISYTLSTVFGVLSTVLGRNRICAIWFLRKGGIY
jgi:hypothetical protein